MQIPQDVERALETAKREVKDFNALAYLNAVPQSIAEYGERGLKTQILYILCNTGSWHGENARECKKVLKRYANEKQKI